MASTGNTFPTVGENNAGIGATAWTNPGNIVSDNTTDATCNAAASSQYLIARNFGFSIPAGATIGGITVRVEASEHTSGTEALLAQLQNDSGTLFGSSKSASNGGNISGTTKAVYTYGATNDLWGAALTPTICNDLDFGVRFWFTTAHDIRIDYVTLAVEYTAATTHTKAGQGTSEFTSSGVRVRDYLRTGAAAAEFTGSGADVAEYSEAATGLSEFVGSGSRLSEYGEEGKGSAEFTASGIRAAEYVRSGAGSMELSGTGADVAEYGEAGTGILEYVARGGTGAIYEPTGYAASEFTAAGVRVSEYGEAGLGALGATVAGTAFKTTAHIKSGAGVVTMVASASSARECLRTGVGALGWKAEGFTSDRVLVKAGKSAMECFAGGGLAGIGIAGSEASLLEALNLRRGNIGIPLIPVGRR